MLDENSRLALIDESAYVLTLDYAIKMLDINERYECGVPVIIEGETGVGKTALVEMLSKLWNQSLLLEWKKLKGRVLYKIETELKKTSAGKIADQYKVRYSVNYCSKDYCKSENKILSITYMYR